MRILHLSSEYPPQAVFGLGRYVQELAEAQAQAGNRVEVFSNSLSGREHEVCRSGVHLRRAHFPPPPKAPVSSSMLLHFNMQLMERFVEIWVKENGAAYDAVNAHDWLTFPAAFHLSRLLNAPLVATIHDVIFNKVQDRPFGPEEEYIAGIESWACHASAKVISLSQSVRAELVEHYQVPLERVAVVPGGVAIQPVSSAELAPMAAWRRRFAAPGESLMLFAGRLDPEKGLPVLMDALLHLREAGVRGWNLAIAGKGQLKERVEAFLGQHDLQGLVKLAGYLDLEQLRLAYAAADIVVVPSTYEPFGLVPLEAQRIGTPVIVAETGGLAECLNLTGGGLAFPPGNPKALAECMARLLSDGSLRARLGAEGKRNVAERFGWDRIATEIGGVYSEIKDAGGARNINAPPWKPPRQVQRSKPAREAPLESRPQQKEPLSDVVILWDTADLEALAPTLEHLAEAHALSALDGRIHVVPVLFSDAKGHAWRKPIEHPRIVYADSNRPEDWQVLFANSAALVSHGRLKQALLKTGFVDPKAMPTVWIDEKLGRDEEGLHVNAPNMLYAAVTKLLCDERFRRHAAPDLLQGIPQVTWPKEARPKPRVLHVLPQLVTGGTETQLLEILKGTQQDFEHRLMVLGPVEGPLPVEVERLGANIQSMEYVSQAQVIEQIARKGPDLLVLHNLSYAPFWIPIHRRLAGCPILEREGVVNIGAGHFGPCEKVICISNATLKPHVPFRGLFESVTSFEVIYNGIDTEAYEACPTKDSARAALGLPAGRPVIGRVSALARNKLSLEALEAIPLVLKDLPDALFVIVGDGPQRAPAEQWVAERGLAESVRFLGERRDLANVLPAFDVFAYYTTKDSMGNVILEAVAAGVPVVATEVEGTGEALGNSPGELVPLGDVQRFAKTVVDWVKNPRPELIAGKAADRLDAKFTRPHMAKQYALAFGGLISPPKSETTGEASSSGPARAPALYAPSHFHFEPIEKWLSQAVDPASLADCPEDLDFAVTKRAKSGPDGMGKKRILFIGPWTGEFGWEICRWQGGVRRLVREEFGEHYVIVASDGGHHPIYAYADEFWALPSFYYRKGLTRNSLGLLPPEPGRVMTGALRALYASRLEEFGLPVDCLPPQRFFPDDQEARAFAASTDAIAFRDRILAERGIRRWVCIFPRNRQLNPEKNWSAENWSNLMRLLADRFECGVVSLGRTEDTADFDCRESWFLGTPNLPAEMRLDVNIAFIQGAIAGISSEGGGAHLALLCGCPTFVMGGPKYQHRFAHEENFLKTPCLFVPKDGYVHPYQEVVDRVLPFVEQCLHDLGRKGEESRPAPAAAPQTVAAEGRQDTPAPNRENRRERKKILFVGVFSDRSTNTSQAAALEHAGTEVTRYDYREVAKRLGDGARDRDLVEECQRLRPDLVLFSKCNEVDVSVVHRCNGIAKTLLWYMDPLNGNFNERLVEKIRYCTLTACALTEPYRQAKAINDRAFFLQEGFDPEVDKPLDVPHRHDVSFIGMLRGERIEYQEALGFHVHTDVFGAEHARAVAESRINLNFTEGGTSDRTYKVLAARGFLLTQPWPGMEEDFQVGRDFDVFTSVEDLRAKIGKYLADEVLRFRIAEQGHRTVQKFSRREWARRLLERADLAGAGRAKP